MKAFTAALMGVAALLPTLVVAEESLITIAAPAANSIVSSQWVQLDAEGNVSGSVFAPIGRPAVAAGQVSLVGDSGEPIVAVVDSNGEFILPDVAPGVYALSFVAENSFAAYALQVVEPHAGQSLPNSTTIIASTLSPVRARTTIARYQPVRLDAAPQVDAASNFSLANASNTAAGLRSYYQVGRNAAGGLDGRLIRAGSVAGGLAPAADVNVLVIREGEVVGQAISSADGTFEVADLPPGLYDLIASGTAGFAALGFELVNTVEPLAAHTENNPFRLASAVVQGPDSNFEVQIAPPSVDLLGPGPEPLGGPPAGPPFGPPPGLAGGGFGGGGGGFGGGGAGGGGGGMNLGSLAGLGGLAAGIVGVSSDNNSRPRRASPGGPPFGPPFDPPGPPDETPPVNTPRRPNQ